MERIKEWWESLDDDTVINKKLLLFMFTTAVLAGILLGVICTPFRSITIASNNEDCGNGNCASNEEDEDD